jgi:C-terminal processing protease CtpA/Prc
MPFVSRRCFSFGARQACAFKILVVVLLVAALSSLAEGGDQAVTLSKLDKDIIELMLKDSADAVRKNYYVASLNGVDFGAAYNTAQQAIRNANSVHQGYEAIAGMLATLDDSHTHFIPPSQPFKVEQGWEMKMVGDKCLVAHVSEGSDAAAKNLKAGDQIAVVDGVKPSRENWENLQYQLRALSPRSSLHLVVISPGEPPRPLVVASKVTPRPASYDLTTNDIWRVQELRQSDWHRYEPRSVELDNVMVWKLPVFFLKEADLDSYFKKADKYPALVLDLRGNPGGSLALMTHMVELVLDHDVKIADSVERDKTKPIVAKSQKDRAYKGKLIILVDSESASSSEMFARVMQLEKRGNVIGDRTAGAVRQARVYPFVHGQGSRYVYATEVTTADLRMTDGRSLEKVGVVPDEVVLPTPEELAAGADPQLARALQLAGSPTSAQKAGMLFPPVKE